MKTRRWRLLAATAGLLFLSVLQADEPAKPLAPALGAGLPTPPRNSADTPPKDAALKPPPISGEWAGTWGPYQPGAEAKKPGPADQPRRLDCKVTAKADGSWQAIFEGECGRPYKYTIQLAGRQVGEVVLFKGTVDLGEKDGGVYDWIGRASDQEFVGFYTSQKYAGAFRMTRPK